ncbi:hypothetical protein IRP63_13965 (plasmid) [Clostridium botulinum]|nr:hypothetical protein [Clostridium botulinum]MCD3232606.1 hypothetical protein [Clostridium botulinum D/C]MCD3238465.1 hypothetical protein [Clostridium botulinum D/C]MCD3266015.1 hypothetical protein [Clostridium botulinum D/C]MCD3301046.1 hypothetical protein [Clostridium botulinum D/C]MCD3304254.1 hypothetical protein [Clostridium botulinum D/C]
MEEMKAIYVIEFNGKRAICVNTDYTKKFSLNTSEMNFIQYLIPLQLQKGLNEWMILRLDDVSKQLNIPRITVNNWFKKLKDTNILIQERFRSNLWKINSNIIEVTIK